MRERDTFSSSCISSWEREESCVQYTPDSSSSKLNEEPEWEEETLDSSSSSLSLIAFCLLRFTWIHSHSHRVKGRKRGYPRRRRRRGFKNSCLVCISSSSFPSSSFCCFWFRNSSLLPLILPVSSPSSLLWITMEECSFHWRVCGSSSCCFLFPLFFVSSSLFFPLLLNTWSSIFFISRSSSCLFLILIPQENQESNLFCLCVSFVSFHSLTDSLGSRIESVLPSSSSEDRIYSSLSIYCHSRRKTEKIIYCMKARIIWIIYPSFFSHFAVTCSSLENQA